MKRLNNQHQIETVVQNVLLGLHETIEPDREGDFTNAAFEYLQEHCGDCGTLEDLCENYLRRINE